MQTIKGHEDSIYRYKQGADALRFVFPHLDHGEGVSVECKAYLGRYVEPRVVK